MDLHKITKELIQFRDDSDWKEFLTTKNLAGGLCSKATCLNETFRNKSDEEIEQIIKNHKDQIKDNLAEIMAYLLWFCRHLDISGDTIETAIYAKIIKEGTNFHLTGHNDNLQDSTNCKIIEFKRDLQQE